MHDAGHGAIHNNTVGSTDMRRPIISLFVAIGLALLGVALMSPVSAHKALIGPNGQIVHRADGQPVMIPDHYRELRVNWPGYLCFAGASLSLAWTLFLVGFGIVALIRQRPNKRVEPTADGACSSASRSTPGVDGGSP
jgi:hypothetical protein